MINVKEGGMQLNDLLFITTISCCVASFQNEFIKMVLVDDI